MVGILIYQELGHFSNKESVQKGRTSAKSQEIQLDGTQKSKRSQMTFLLNNEGKQAGVEEHHTIQYITSVRDEGLENLYPRMKDSSEDRNSQIGNGKQTH